MQREDTYWRNNPIRLSNFRFYVTCDSFKSATYNSVRFRYVRQLSGPLRPTAFDSVTCDSFQVRYVEQLSIPLRATAFKFATYNSFRFRYVRQLSSSLRTTAFKLFFQCMNHSLIISVLTQDRLFCPYASLFVLFISSRSLTMHIQLFY